MRRAATAALVALLGGAALVPVALARPAYREAAVRQFGYPGSLLNRSTMSCTFCHVSERGGAPWNVFGEELRGALRERPGARFPEVLHGVLARDLDADCDGYADALEVFARTLPGDPDSHPTEAEAALRTRFEAAGGADLYRPKAAK
ncbi:hypothetical protein [Deinococcus pimensis]|uniref:hypothetical protein n=1 Tax=Deinococcus pimensis TaxID=309888 RepID=UPI0005EAE13D|nr:hypothetical protein [Deinococcus pimensis]